MTILRSMALLALLSGLAGCGDESPAFNPADGGTGDTDSDSDTDSDTDSDSDSDTDTGTGPPSCPHTCVPAAVCEELEGTEQADLPCADEADVCCEAGIDPCTSGDETGEVCPEAVTLGRDDLPAMINGETIPMTDDHNVPCWDYQQPGRDIAYRVFLFPGETLHVTLSPDVDLDLFLFSEADGDQLCLEPELIDCGARGGSQMEHVVATADAHGWIYILVDAYQADLQGAFVLKAVIADPAADQCYGGDGFVPGSWDCLGIGEDSPGDCEPVFELGLGVGCGDDDCDENGGESIQSCPDDCDPGDVTELPCDAHIDCVFYEWPTDPPGYWECQGDPGECVAVSDATYCDDPPGCEEEWGETPASCAADCAPENLDGDCWNDYDCLYLEWL
jgi:predicted small lipoprotein YifL